MPAGRHRFVVPGDGATLTFEVQIGRVQAAQLDGHQEVTLFPVPRWQAALMTLGRQLRLPGTMAPRLTE